MLIFVNNNICIQTELKIISFFGQFYNKDQLLICISGRNYKKGLRPPTVTIRYWKTVSAVQKCRFSELKWTFGLSESLNNSELRTLKWSFDKVLECSDKKSLSSVLFQQTSKFKENAAEISVPVDFSNKCWFFL